MKIYYCSRPRTEHMTYFGVLICPHAKSYTKSTQCLPRLLRNYDFNENDVLQNQFHHGLININKN